MSCLNKAHKGVKKWIKSVGEKETYRQLLIHNYQLPKYDVFVEKNALGGLSKIEREDLLNNYLTLDNYSTEVIDQIRSLTPDAEAAFWKNTFYFAESANKLQVNEEAFHAIFQTLTSPEDRKKLFIIAENLLNDKIKKNNLSKSKIYEEYRQDFKRAGKKVTEQRLKEYVLEEELAKTWVNWETYDNDLIRDSEYSKIWASKDASFVQKILDTLKEFFTKLSNIVTGYNKNATYLDNFFEKIKKGQNKISPILKENNSYNFPSLSALQLSSDTPGRDAFILDSTEQIIHYGKIMSIILQFRELDVVDSEGNAYTDDQIIEEAIYTYNDEILAGYAIGTDEYDFYEELLPVEDFFTKEIERSYILQIVKSDLKEKLDRLSAANSEMEAIDENTGVIGIQSDAANQVDAMNSLPERVKLLIASVEVSEASDQKITVTRSRMVGGKVEMSTFEMTPRRMVDPTKVYAALIRATTNTVGEEERLRKLVMFATDTDLNTDTNAFLNDFLKKVFVHNDGMGTKLGYRSLKALKTEILSGTLVDYKVSDAGLYQLVMKAFDLWTRRNLIIRATEHGFSAAYDPNITNVRNRQIELWNNAFEAKSPKQRFKEFEFASRASSDFLFSHSKSMNPEFTEEDMDKSLAALNDVFKFYSINVSKNFKKFIVAKKYIEVLESHKTENKLPESYRQVYVSTFFEDGEFDLDLVGLRGAIETTKKVDLENVSPYHETGDNTDISSAARMIALGNSQFDETVLASTFLNAENKTIFAHQYQTFMLKFANYTLKNKKRYQEYIEDLVGQNRYNAHVFLNNFLHNFYENELTERDRQGLGSFSFAGFTKHVGDIKGTIGREEAAAVNDLSSVDAVAFQMNALLHRAKVIAAKKTSKLDNVEEGLENALVTAPFFLGHNETSNTKSFFSGKWMTRMIDKFGNSRSLYNLVEGKIGSGAVLLARDIVDQQINRIEAFKAEFDQLILPTLKFPNSTGEETVVLTEKMWRDVGFTGQGLVSGFYTGTVPLVLKGQIWQIDAAKLATKLYEKKSPRGFLILKNLNGYVTNRNLIYNQIFNAKAENFEEELNADIAKSLQKTIDASITLISGSKLLDSIYYGTPKDDKYHIKIYNTLGFVKTSDTMSRDKAKKYNLSLFFLNSMFNRENYQRILHGDQGLTNTNATEDIVKRNKGEESQVSSIYTKLGNDYHATTPNLEVKIVQMVEPTNQLSGVTGKNINSNDGGLYRSVKHTLQYLHGLQKLSAPLVKSLDKMWSGRDFTPQDEIRIRETNSFLTVEKSREFSSMSDMKTAETVLYKTDTAQKVEVTDPTILAELYKYIEVQETLYGASYRSLPAENADLELTVEFDQAKHTTYETALLAGGVRVFEWIPISVELDNYRKLLEGWEFNRATNKWTYKASQEIGLLGPITVHKRLKQDIWGGDIESFSGEIHVHTQTAMNYGRQVENTVHKDLSHPTQQIEILTSNLPDIVPMFNEASGTVKNKTRADIIEQYFTALALRDSISTEETLKILMPNGVVDYEILNSTIRDSLLETGGDTQLAEFFATNPDGTSVLNGNILLIKNKTEQMLFSLLSKNILSHKVPGDGFAMISPKGRMILKKLTKETVEGKEIFSWTVVPRKSKEFVNNFRNATRVGEGLTYNGHTYLNAPDTGTLVPVLEGLWKDGTDIYFFDELRHLKPHVVNGFVENYYSEAVASKGKGQRYVQGVRIPSQDKATSANIEIVDLLDTILGNTVSVAKEIQELSGADFDIDKLYIQFYEGRVDDFGNFTRYENTFEDYIDYIFSINKLLKKKLKNSTDKSTEGKIDILEKAKLPYNEIIFQQSFGKIGFKAILNNELLDLEKALLTANIKSYSRPTSIEVFKNYFSGEVGTDVLGVSTKEFEDIVSHEADYPINSPLFDALYQDKTLAGQAAIGATVTANTVWLALSRAGAKLNPKYKINIRVDAENPNDEPKDLEYLDFAQVTKQIKQEEERYVSEHNSESISAATDEPKEGAYAKYNIIGDLMEVLSTGQSLGIHPQILILLANHKVLQRLAKSALKDPLGKGSKKFIDLLHEFLYAGAVIGKDIEFIDLEIQHAEVTIRDLQIGISNATHNSKDVIATAYKIMKISEANKDLVKVMSLKKGFGVDVEDYLNIYKAATRLSLPVDVGMLANEAAFPEIAANKIHDVYMTKDNEKGIDLENPGFVQVKGHLNNSLPELHKIIEKVLIEGSSNFIELYNYVHTSIATSSFTRQDLTQALHIALMGNLAANDPKMKETLSVDLLTGPNSVAAKFLEFLKTEPGFKNQPLVKKMTAMSGFNIVMKRLNKKAKNLKKQNSEELKKEAENILRMDTLNLNLFAKMSPDVQSTLVDNYVLLKGFSGGEITEVQEWVNSLLPYIMVKDGLRYSPVSPSKIIPAKEFKTLSAEYDAFMNKDLDMEYIKEDVLERVLRDVRNIKLIDRFESPSADAVLFEFKNAKGESQHIYKRQGRGGILIINETDPAPALSYRRAGDTVYKLIGSYKDFRNSRDADVVKEIHFTRHTYVVLPSVGTNDYHASVSNTNIVGDNSLYINTMDSITEGVAYLKGIQTGTTTERARLFAADIEKMVVETRKHYLKALKIVAADGKEILTGLELMQKYSDKYTLSSKKANLATNTVAKTNVQGIEINSYETGLGGQLTNVHKATAGESEFDVIPSDKTLTLTASDKYKWGKSVEAWYKSNNAKSKGIPEGVEGDLYDMKLMVGLITDKLTQHPNLVKQINEKGGLGFLENSTHTMGTGRWSSANSKNMFMNALIQAYKNVEQLAKPVESLPSPIKKENPVNINAENIKDQTKADYADGIIGYGVGSTGKYAKAFKGTRTAFKPGEIIMISVNGRGRPNQAESVEKTKKAIDLAISQGVSFFIADNKTVAFSPHNENGEGVIFDYLQSKEGVLSRNFNGVLLYTVEDLEKETGNLDDLGLNTKGITKEDFKCKNKK